MKAVLCRPTPVKYLLMRALSKRNPWLIYSAFGMTQLADIPEPKLIDEEWVKIRVTLSGICGSDIGGLNGQESLYLENYVSKSFVLGHENIGVITETGKKVTGLMPNDRVVVIPFLSCRQRGFKELCRYCKNGDYALCENVNEGNLSHGLSIGWNSDTSGGWAEYFIAHYSNVIKIPDEIDDDSAVMIDSFSCALHSVMQNPQKHDEVVLVYGCGTMGLNTILAIRSLGLKNRIIAIYSRGFQKEMAQKNGADILLNMKDEVYKRIAEITNARLYYPTIGMPAMEGGVDVVYDCVANNNTINNSLRFIRGKGRLVMIATAGILRNIDVAPLWFREISIIGSCEQGHERYNSKIKSTYQIVIDMLREKKLSLKEFVTHKFPLIRFREAIKTAINKDEKVIKVVLYP